ncbi:hypothetical protein [Hominenteromicrobium sp.]
MRKLTYSVVFAVCSLDGSDGAGVGVGAGVAVADGVLVILMYCAKM